MDLMKYSKHTYWSILFMALLFACKDTHEVKPATYSLFLTGEESKSWQQTSFTFIFDDEEIGEFDANLIYGIPDCDLDDVYTYLREGKQLEIYQGNDKCNPDGDDLRFRTQWDIVNANATLLIGGGDPFILSSLTQDSLVFGFRDTLSAPLSIHDKIFIEYPGIAQWVYKSIN